MNDLHIRRSLFAQYLLVIKRKRKMPALCEQHASRMHCAFAQHPIDRAETESRVQCIFNRLLLLLVYFVFRRTVYLLRLLCQYE